MVKQGAAMVRPRLRFPEFGGEPWDSKSLKEIAPLQRGFDLPSSEVQPGSVPVFYSNGVQRFHNVGMVSAPGLMTGRSGTIGKLHFIENGEYWPHNTSLWVTSFKGNVAKFVYFLFDAIGMGRFSSGSGVPTMNRNDVHAHISAVPRSLAEQQKIADCVTSLDEVIAAQGRKVEALKAHKRGLMQQLFPREGKTRPRLRFPEFHDAPEWRYMLLRELEDKKLVQLGRGDVISHDDMRANPGLNPVYSSSVINQGLMGTYGEYMFDEELISWSIDGGGHFFHRPKHKFSVTNVSGFMRVLSNEVICSFLALQLQQLHASQKFDYQQKAHPSVIRALYSVGLPDPREQQRIANCLSSLDTQITAESNQLTALKTHKQGLMQQLFPAPDAATA